MRKILFVEDDVLIAKVYSQKLAAEGFDVRIAEDGLVAVQRLREFVPDLVVLDLLMPKLDGVDVLKFIRREPTLKNTRIIVFSNSFLSNLIEQVAAIGVEEALIKASVAPKQLVEIINTILERPPRIYLDPKQMMEHLSGVSGEAPASLPQTVATANTTRSGANPPPPAAESAVGKQFSEQLPVILQSVRKICGEFLEADSTPVEPRKLEDLCRKIGFVAQTFGLAGRHQMAQLVSALEAMLFELREKPSAITDSNRHTIAATVAFLAAQAGHAASEGLQPVLKAKVLVVDDDAVSNRAVVLALGRAQLAAAGTTDPYDALNQLRETAYALVLLDVNMPGLDGIALCEQLRRFPQHAKTPVIFVTGQSDFKTRVRSVLSGGNDLISKPILPAELCVKVLTHLLKMNNDMLAPVR